MTFTDKNIVENYFSLFESLNSISKLELIEKLTITSLESLNRDEIDSNSRNLLTELDSSAVRRSL